MRAGFSIEVVYFARPAHGRIVANDVDDKIKEFGLALEGGVADVTINDAIGLIRKCAQSVPVPILTPSQYIHLAREQRNSWETDGTWPISEWVNVNAAEVLDALYLNYKDRVAWDWGLTMSDEDERPDDYTLRIDEFRFRWGVEEDWATDITQKLLL